jgi:hypothetical protein
MKLKKNTCFVIMGFGKKNHTDFGIIFDLDKAYQKIIRPAAEKLGYECIRANEIDDSGLIEKSMYAILMQADLVIAYVTTDNANAMYEVGIREAVHPNSTIILNKKQGEKRFDVGQNKMCIYTPLGQVIGDREAEECQEKIIELIHNVNKDRVIDSPLFEFIKDIIPDLPDD